MWKVIAKNEAWQKQLQDDLNHACQELLKSEKELNHFSQLVARYKKGKTSWEQQANLLAFELQEAHQELQEVREELVQQEELLDLKNTTIANLAEQLKRLKKEVGQQNQANSKKKKQLQRARLRISQDQQKITNQANLINQLQQAKQNLQAQVQSEKTRADNLQAGKDSHICSCPQICCVNGDYTQIKQECDNYQAQINSHQCPSVDNSELANLRLEIQAKDQKIAELETEIKALKDKSPVLGNNSKREKLLAIVQEKEQIIKELEFKLNQTEPQAIVKEVESGTIIQGLRGKLNQQEQKIKQLHVIYLLLLGISTLITVGLISKKKKISK